MRRDEQAGFRANRGCFDQSNTIRLIVEQSLEFQSPLYLVFVDFEKAFDRIDREAIWNTLAKRNIPAKIIRLIRALYENASCSVLHCGKLSDKFTVETGVRQGCVLSPLLFITVLDEVLRETVQQGQQRIWWTLNQTTEPRNWTTWTLLTMFACCPIPSAACRLNYEDFTRPGS